MSRVISYLNYFVGARRYRSKELLVNLIVADQMKATLIEESSKYIALLENGRCFRPDSFR